MRTSSIENQIDFIHFCVKKKNNYDSGQHILAFLYHLNAASIKHSNVEYSNLISHKNVKYNSIGLALAIVPPRGILYTMIYK